MRGHTHVESLLALYRDLSPVERREVDAHLQVCLVCAGRLAAYRRMDRAIVTFMDEQQARITRPRSVARVAPALRPETHGRRPDLHLLLVGLAVLALLISLAPYAVQDQRRPLSPSLVTAAPLPTARSTTTLVPTPTPAVPSGGVATASTAPTSASGALLGPTEAPAPQSVPVTPET